MLSKVRPKQQDHPKRTAIDKKKIGITQAQLIFNKKMLKKKHAKK